jgi:hypothetical protein
VKKEEEGIETGLIRSIEYFSSVGLDWIGLDWLRPMPPGSIGLAGNGLGNGLA